MVVICQDQHVFNTSRSYLKVCVIDDDVLNAVVSAGVRVANICRNVTINSKDSCFIAAIHNFDSEER